MHSVTKHFYSETESNPLFLILNTEMATKLYNRVFEEHKIVFNSLKEADL